MRPSRPVMRVSLSLAWCLGLLVLAGPSGCGPATPGDPANMESRTAGSRPASASEARSIGRGERTHSLSLAAHPAASPVSGGPGAARPAAPLVVPDSLRVALASPDVRVRLRALDRWASQNQENQEAEGDLLLAALEDEEEQVRAKALALLEQAWAQAQAATER